MYYSLNEIDALCRKAARGAGLPWGLAQEAGFSARWLAAYQLPGPALLAALLRAQRGINYRDRAPRVSSGQWHAQEQALCPLITGVTLADHATLIAVDDQLTLLAVRYPLLLLPSIALMARHQQTALALSWAGIDFTVDPQQSLAWQGTTLDTPLAQRVVLHATNHTYTIMPQTPGPCEIDPLTYEQLDTLARRTYAPASELSRRQDAGA